jgi:alpha/beta superfamily hydrolase
MNLTSHEELVFVPAGSQTMAGVLTVPAHPIGLTAIIPWGAGAFPSSARNQFRTRLAREIAELGIHAFRFDYPGVGEADGTYRTPTMARPFTDEIVAAYEWIGRQGLQRPVIIANCLGGWSVLKAVHRLPDLEGLIVFNCPVRRDHQEVRVQEAGWKWWASRLRKLHWRNLFNARHRARYTRLVKAKASAVTGVGLLSASHFIKQVGAMARMSVPMVFVYGSDGFRADFEDAMGQGLREILAAAGPSTKAVLLSGRIEGFPTLASQDQLVELTLSWLRESVAASVVGTTGQP